MPSQKDIDAMFAAAEAGDLKKVQKLLKAGVQPDAAEGSDKIPLMAAVSKGHEDIFLQLVKAGANVHAAKSSGWPVLMSVVGEKGTLPMVQAVIDAGIQPEDRLQDAFCFACAFSSEEIIKVLLAVGGDVNKMGSMFRATPLVWAVYYNRPEIVRILLMAGANPVTSVPRADPFRDAYCKKTALEVARLEGYTDIVKLLETAGAKEAPKPKHPTMPGTVAECWKRIGKWLKRNAPDWKPLKKGASTKQIEGTEKKLGFKLPAELRESYLIHNGSDSAQVFPCPDDISYYFADLGEVVSAWKDWKALLDMGDFQGCKAKGGKGVRSDWWNVGWIPFASNGGGDYFCIDMAPAKGGKVGQVIFMRHDSEKRSLLAASVRDWLHELANGLEDGKYTYAGDDGIV